VFRPFLRLFFATININAKAANIVSSFVMIHHQTLCDPSWNQQLIAKQATRFCGTVNPFDQAPTFNALKGEIFMVLHGELSHLAMH